MLLLFTSLGGMLSVGYVIGTETRPRYIVSNLTVTEAIYRTVSEPQYYTVTVPTAVTVNVPQAYTVTERGYVTVTVLQYIGAVTSTTYTGGNIIPTSGPIPSGSMAQVTFIHYSWNTSVQLDAVAVDQTNGFSTSIYLQRDPNIYNPNIQYKYTATLGGLMSGRDYVLIVRRVGGSNVFYQPYTVNCNLQVTIN